MEQEGRFRGSNTILTLAVLGLVISLYLLYHHTAVVFGYQSGPSFCSVNATLDCDAVAASKYSVLRGVPVASLGALFYLIVIGFVAFARVSPTYRQSHFSAVAVFLSLIGTLLALIYLGISVVLIQKLCLLCLSLDIINLIMLLVAIRSREEAESVWSLFRRGGAVISDFLKAGGSLSDPRRVTSLLSISAVVLSFLALTFVPSFLLVNVLVKSEEASRADVSVEAAIEDWKRAPAVELAISDSEELLERDFGVGDPDSPVQIVMFSDFECPHCRKAADLVHELMEQYPIYVIFKNFPLDARCNSLISRGSGHQFACQAAEIARCAGMQGEDKFWAMHDLIFAQEELNTDLINELQSEVAFEELGIKKDQFDHCMSQPGLMTDRVKADVAVGQRLRLQSTPSVFINGKPLRRPTSDTIIALVQKLVDEAPAPLATDDATKGE